MLRLSTSGSLNSKKRRLSSPSSLSSKASSSSSSSSSISSSSSNSSGASVGSWDPNGYASDVDQKRILVNGKVEHVAHWYDNTSTNPLPGQHRLRDANGKVITAVKAAEDRQLKQNLKFTGVTTGKKHRLSFKTVNDAVETVPLCTQDVNTLTGERGPWKESSIKVDRIPDLSAASDRDHTIIARQKKRLMRPKTILVDGKEVKPSRYYENVWDNRPSVELFPGQTGIYCQVGNYAKDAVADWEKHTKRDLNRYVGYEKRGNVKMRSFRTASFDKEMGNVGKPVNFMKQTKGTD